MVIAAATALAIALAHHDRRTGLVRIDLDGHVANHVFVDLGLALELGDHAGRRVDFEHHIMRLAVLRDAIGQRTETPGLGLDDLAAVILDDLGGGFRQCVHLRLCQILARKEHMLVQSHVVFSLLADC